MFVLPDILANAGGVTVSYFEWVQGLYSFFWSEDEVNAKLEVIMKKAFHDVLGNTKKYNTHMRDGGRNPWPSAALRRRRGSAGSIRMQLV